MCAMLSHNNDILNLLLKVIDNYTNDPQLLIRCAFVLGRRRLLTISYFDTVEIGKIVQTLKNNSNNN